MRDRINDEDLAALEAVFRDEALELLERLETCLLDLERDASDRSLIEGSFRHLHTLKGIAAMYGYDRLSALAHRLESNFDEVRRNEAARAVSSEVLTLALRSLDCMRGLARDRGGEADDELKEQAASLLEALDTGPLGDSSAQTSSPVVLAESGLGYHIRLAPGEDSFFRGLRPENILDELRTLGECHVEPDTSAVPDLGEYDCEKLYVRWLVTLRTDAPIARIQEALMFLLEDEYEIEPLTPVAVERGGLDRRGGEDRRVGPRRFADFAADDTVRVPSRRLDQLVDMVGELVTAHGALAALAIDANEVRLSGTAEEIGRLVGGLRESVLEIRMVPIGTLFGRFRRYVRDLACELGKDVEIIAEGAETEMDKGVLDRIGEPVLHILRNCIDHGIESPEERAASGKPRQGTIRFLAHQAGGLVHIEISDDGRGLDLPKIRTRAIEKGIFGPDDEPGDETLVSLLFDSGFSTTDTVTQVSGRGVGLDVVKRTLDDLNGTISMAADSRSGTRIRLSVPLTLAIIDGLLATVGDERYIIPLAVVESCAQASQPDVWKEHGRELLDVHGSLVPLVRLRRFFSVPGTVSETEIAVISSFEGRRFGIVVDSIQDSIQVVIKPFGRLVRGVNGLSGTTVLGDGSAVPVLDPGDLLHVAESESGEGDAASKS